jgi:hypothetical protein
MSNFATALQACFALKLQLKSFNFDADLFQICVFKQHSHEHLNVLQKKEIYNTFVKLKQRNLENVNNYLNTNIYSYLETSGG